METFMDRCLLAVAFVTCCSVAGFSARAAENLIANGGMEPPAADGVPAQWEKQAISTPAQFSLDENQKHSGRSSARLDAAETARSYFRGATTIPVAPGEELRGSAWVRIENVPPETGAVIMIANFADADGRNETVEKF